MKPAVERAATQWKDDRVPQMRILDLQARFKMTTLNENGWIHFTHQIQGTCHNFICLSFHATATLVERSQETSGQQVTGVEIEIC